MRKLRKFRLLPEYHDKSISFATMGLTIFGSLMIVSASMGGANGSTQEVLLTLVKQVAFIVLGYGLMIGVTKLPYFRFTLTLYKYVAVIMIVLLILPRLLYDPVGGAYAWYWFGPFSFQISEFAKLFVILFIAKYLCMPYKSDVVANEKFNFVLAIALIYAIIIVIFQKDLGSGVILAGIAYFMILLPKHKMYLKVQGIMEKIFYFGIVIVLVVISPIGTKLFESLNSNNYMINRFLASANPFKYQYDSGYHLVMSLVSFANGGLTGLGYGKSIHKYMNFPNPTSDFILPVIIEEMGVLFGFMPILILYAMLLVPMIKYACAKTTSTRSKMVLLGISMYFILHFILNVGGVSGLIPLTGVPILLISYGGTNTWASLIAIGIAQKEISSIRKELIDANNSGQIS